MVYKCSASGCKSGYESQKKNNTVTFHSFPLKDTNLLSKWIVAKPNVNFVPTRHSRLCSLHFQPQDFIQESSDTNVTRRKRISSRTLYVRRLKRGVYPTIFDITSPKSTKEFGKAEAISLTIHELSESSSTHAVDDDSVETTIEDLSKYFKTNPIPGYHITLQNDRLLIYLLNLRNDIPVISCSLTIKPNLKPVVSMDSKVVSIEIFEDIVSGRINKFSQLLELLYRMKSWIKGCPDTPESSKIVVEYNL